MITPRWDGQRWRIQARKDGKRYSFSSSVEGSKGRKEVIRKYESWYYGEASGEKSVGQVCKEYLADVKARCGEKSPAYIQYERYIRLYVAPVLAPKKICKTTLRDWQSVINNAQGRKKELSEKTLKNLRGIIMSIVKFAYEDYQCEPLRGSLYIPKGHFKLEKEILPREDIQKLFEPSDLFYSPLFKFLLVTGLRPSEGLGIKVSDIQGDRVYIRRAVNSQGIITTGKTANARRLIPIGNLAKSILEETIKRNEELNLRTEWVFCSPDGSMGNQSTMRNHWNTLKKERGLAGSVYSLRHTFISYTKSTLPEQILRDVVGHSATMSTFETYGHIVEGEARQAADIIDLTFGAVFGDNKSISDGQSE